MRSIVVVGGGFAGLNAALSAVRIGGERILVSLISREPWLTIRPRLYERHPEELRTSLLMPLTTVGANFVEGEATEVSADGVRLASGDLIPCDRLVIATGSVMKRPAFPGSEACFSIDDRQSAMALDARLAALSKVETPCIVVVGAGFTGIELALELRDRIAEHVGEAIAERARIFLVDAAPQVGAELGDAPRPLIEKALADARIEIRPSARISLATDRCVTLADGEEIVCSIVVLCTGLVAAPIIAGVGGDKDKYGRLVVDPNLRAPSAPNVFVAGDAACAMPAPGRQTLMSCQHALTLGKFAGENAARDLFGLPLLVYEQPRYVTCLHLGRSGAVFSEGWDRAPKLTGNEAKAIKTEINTRWIYPPSGSREDILNAARIS